MGRLGVPVDQVQKDARQADSVEAGIQLAPHLFTVVDVFANLRSQWRTASAGMGGFLYSGLDYGAIEPTMRMMGVKVADADTADFFKHLKVMEMAAREAMNER